MSDSYIRFGKEEDQEALLAGLYPSADEEDREGAVTALRNLAQAAAQPDAFPSVEELTEMVTAALRLGMAPGSGPGQALEEGDSLTLPDTLEPLLDRLNENSQAVMIEVRAELAAFRYAVALWDDLCSGLGPLHCAPPAVRKAAEAFLDSLDVLSRSLALVRRWRAQKDHPWLSDLQRGLEEAREDAIRRIEGSQARERLWPLCDKAGELRLGDLLPSLTTLLARWSKLPGGDPALVLAGKAGYSFEQILREGSVIPEERPEWTDSLVREIMRLAEKGLLGQVDMEAARKAMAEAPARWAKAHQEALRRNGLKMPVFLIQSDQGLWTAPEVLRITPEEVRQAPGSSPGQALAQLPGTDRAALTAGGEGSSVPAVWQQRKSSLLALPDNLPVEGLALASRELHLAGVRLLLFGDDRGLWCAVWGAQGKASARCHGLEEEIYGSQVQIPLIQVGPVLSPVEGGGAGSRQALGFRPGPLRKLIRTYQNIDRAYSRRAYVITVGESLLRNLLGWDLRQSTQSLNQIACEAGVRTYTELRSGLLEAAGKGLPSWIGEIQTAEGIRPKTGASNLGELVESWSKLTPTELGAEIDTLMSLPPDKIGPVDGDLFVLIPTDTATSLLCALLIGQWLHGRFPYSDLRIRPCEALKQREQLQHPDGSFEQRHDLPKDVSQLYQMLDGLMKDLLTEDAADPVLLIPGGVKWTTLLMLQVSRARHLACVYKFEPNRQEVKPVVFRWDEWAMQMLASQSDVSTAEQAALPEGRESVQPAAPAGPKEPEGERPCPVINVGTGLFWRYCDEKKLNRNTIRADAGQLVRWALETDRNERWRLCAELTGFEAWKRATHTEASKAVVALIQTASENGRACGEAVEALLRDQGAEVLRQTEWEVLDLTHITGIDEKEQVRQICRQILDPFRRCLGDLAEVHLRPDVLTMAGQALTSALMQFSATSRGIRVFLAPEAERGKLPALWPFPAVPLEPDAPIPIRDAESAWD